MRSLALRDAALAELVGDATRRAFTRIVDMALEEQVDAVLIAGDLYDGDQTSMKTARFIGEAFKRLSESGVRVFLIRGNHDNLSRITRELTLPEGVVLFGGQAGVETIARAGAQPIAIHGLSFREAEAPQSLLPKYKAPVPDAVNIGLMHTSLGGAPGHDPYAPVSVAELDAAGFRYWALGHIHRRSVHEGKATIVMPGMPQGRDIGEAGPKSATLVTIGDDGGITLEERVTSSAVFASAQADAAGEEDWDGLVRRLARAAEAAAAPGCATILRVRLTGATPLAWRVRRDLDALKAEVELALGEGAGLWIEKLEADCRPGAGPPETGPLAELEQLLSSEVLPSDGFRHGAGAMGEALLKLLPPDVRDRFGGTEEETAAFLDRLAAEGVAYVLARLRADGSAR